MRQWGLKPEESTSGNGATYVLSGHIVTGASSDPRSVHLAESMGREGQAKAKRKLAAKEADRALKELLERDKEGMKAVMKARETHAGKEKDKNKGAMKGASRSVVGKKRTKKELDSDEEESEDDGDVQSKDDNMPKAPYSAGVIKSLGFDPSMKPGQRRVENKSMQNKVCVFKKVCGRFAYRFYADPTFLFLIVGNARGSAHCEERNRFGT
jgi:minichromosome maintenance protein 10